MPRLGGFPAFNCCLRRRSSCTPSRRRLSRQGQGREQCPRRTLSHQPQSSPPWAPARQSALVAPASMAPQGCLSDQSSVITPNLQRAIVAGGYGYRCSSRVPIEKFLWLEIHVLKLAPLLGLEVGLSPVRHAARTLERPGGPHQSRRWRPRSRRAGPTGCALRPPVQTSYTGAPVPALSRLAQRARR